MNSESIFNLSFARLDLAGVCDFIVCKAEKRESGFICVTNAHMIVEAKTDVKYCDILSDATLMVPDGMPLVWLLNSKSDFRYERVAGYDLISSLCGEMEKIGLKLFLYGGTEKQNARISKNLETSFPDLQLVGALSPPFRSLSPSEERFFSEQINSVKPDVILVALGCPKQERWMQRNTSNINAILIGIGGASRLIAGDFPRAPQLMRRLGFEWLFRLYLEPKRLWKRYLVTNTLFIFFVIRELLKDLRKE